MSDQKAWTDTIHEWTEEFADNDPVSYRLDRAGDLYALSDRWRYANDDSPSGRELARMILADRASAERREKAVRELIAKGEALATRLDEVREASKGVFVMAHVHGMAYDGPTYSEPLAEFRAALAAVRETTIGATTQEEP